MSLFAPFKKEQSKVHYSQYLRTEDKTKETGEKTEDLVTPTTTETT